MTRYVYMVESSSETAIIGIKMFSSYKAAKRFTKYLPQLKHKITQHEIYNLNSF